MCQVLFEWDVQVVTDVLCQLVVVLIHKYFEMLVHFWLIVIRGVAC